MGELKKLALSEIRENPVALRSVNMQSEEFLGIVDSINQKGFIGAITVRPNKDEKSGEEYFEIVDGLHRYTAAKEAGIDEINVVIVDFDDDAMLEAQIMQNMHKVETTPAQYAKQLRRILARNPLMTESELATKLAKSPSWIRSRLSLNKIEDEKILQLIDEGKIVLSNAYALAKLPTEEQAAFLDRAMTVKPTKFNEDVTTRVKELRESARQGKDAKQAEFSPAAHFQKLKDVKAELETGDRGKVLCKDLDNPVDGFKRAIEWVLHLDPESVKVQKAEWEERLAKKEEAKKKRKAEQAKKKAEKAKKKAEAAAKAAAEAEEAEEAANE